MVSSGSAWLDARSASPNSNNRGLEKPVVIGVGYVNSYAILGGRGEVDIARWA